MLYDGISLDLPEGKVSISHSDAFDIIRGQSSSENTAWLDALGNIPWGVLKETHPAQFEQASKIFSLVNMDYQICNGGISQYFYNGYHEKGSPFHEDDVFRADLDVQKEYFTEVVSFGKKVFPGRQNENTALEKACDAFQELWYEEDAEVVETIESGDEYIWDDELGEEVPNPDYFEPYEETTYENVIHGDCGFDDTFYAGNDYLEELLELQAQLCCKQLVRDVERENGKESDQMNELRKTLPEAAFSKPLLNERIQAAAGKAADSNKQEISPMEMTPTMDVLLIKPNMYPQRMQIGCELEDLQKAVGGYIQAIYPFEDPVALVMNEEGKLNGSEFNRALRDEDGGIYDIVAGDFLVVGLGEEDFSSLPPELMKKYEKHFHQPEMFVLLGSSIIAVPLSDDMVKKGDAPVKKVPAPHKSSHDRDLL